MQLKPALAAAITRLTADHVPSPRLNAELLLIWGRQDPHVPLEGRRDIHHALDAAEANYQWHEFKGAHAFARDEGPRHDAAATRLGLSIALELFQPFIIRRLKELGHADTIRMALEQALMNARSEAFQGRYRAAIAALEAELDKHGEAGQ